MTLQIVFSIRITIQFLVVVLHDWIDLPGWTHGRQVMAVLGRRKMIAGTLINAIFPGLAAAFAIYFWNKPKPLRVEDYWLLYCAVTLISAIAMWYIPYLFGASEKLKRMYEQMYAGT